MRLSLSTPMHGCVWRKSEKVPEPKKFASEDNNDFLGKHGCEGLSRFDVRQITLQVCVELIKYRTNEEIYIIRFSFC